MTDSGRVIDTAYVEIRPKAAEGFDRDLEKQIDGPADRMASRVGTRVGTVVGKGIGLALNEKVQAGVGAALGVLQKFSDDQQAAQNKLTSAIESAGGSIGDYQGKIDRLVDSNERLGLSQDVTKDRLAELTLALGSPAKALAEIGEAQDIAAGTGRSFATVVEILKRANEGSVEAYRLLGIEVKDLTKARKDLTSADSEASKAKDTETRAQQTFNDKLAVYQQATSHTLAQQQSLYQSYEALQRAKAGDVTASAKVIVAQKEVRAATNEQKDALQTLADKYKGQASAGADSFTGKVKAYTAELKDSAGDIVAKYGNAAGGIGFALLGLSSTTKIVKEAFRSMRDVEVATSGEAALAVETNAARASAAMVAEGDVAVTQSGRILGALSRIGPAAVIAVSALQVLNDAKNGKLTTKELPDSQYTAALSLIQQAKGVNAPKLGSASDLIGLAGKITAGKVDLSDLGAGKVSPDQIQQILQIITTKLAQFGLNPDGTPIGGGNAFGRGIDSDNPNVATRAQNGVVAAGTKLGKAAGKATHDSFGDFLKQYGLGDPINAALDAAHDKAVAAAQSLVDAVSAKLDAARSKLQSDLASMRGEQLQIAQTVTQGSTLGDAFTNGFSSARNAIGDRPVAGGGVAGVEAFLHTRAVKIARFARALNQLRKKGLDARLISEIAQLGTDQGLQIAEDLLAGTSSDIRSINLSSQQIARAANVVGANIAKADYGSIIAADNKNTATLKAQLEGVNNKLNTLIRQPKALNVSVARTGASSADIGRDVGREVSLSVKGM